MKLFVAGLPRDFDKTDLKEMFELYGEITEVIIVQDRHTGLSRGFGFVTMSNQAEAREVINLFKNAKIKGRQIVVKQAEEQQNFNSGNNFNRGR